MSIGISTIHAMVENMIKGTKISVEQMKHFILDALKEDIGEGDHTSLACIDATDRSKAKLLVKDECVLAGVEFAKFAFEIIDPTSTIQIIKEDGEAVSFGDIAFLVECNSQALLKVERLILNTMQRMSGIATMANRFKFEVEDLPAVSYTHLTLPTNREV